MCTYRSLKSSTDRLIGLICIILFSGVYAASATEDIMPGWLDDLDKAIEAGKATHRPVLLHLYDRGAISSVLLRKKTFSSPLVQSQLKDFIKVEIDVTKNPIGKERFNSPAIPFVAFFDFQGNELFRNRVQERVDHKILAMRIQTARKDMDEFEAALERMKANPGDLETRLRVASGYEDRQLEREAIAEYRNIVNGKNVSNDLRDQALAGWAHSLMSMGMRKMKDQQWEEVCAIMQEFLGEFPSTNPALIGDLESQATYFLALGKHKLGNDDDAKKLLKQLAKNDDVWGIKARNELGI